jgi:methylated-DNA-[protein]-cysteine S-methyltransferase
MSAAPYAAIVPAPGFCLGLRLSGDEAAVTEIHFLEACAEQLPTAPLAREAARQLQAYLADAAFAFTLPLQVAGTPFRQQVWQQIAAIPCGQTRTYGQLAAALGSAPRAVGGACGDNPLPVVVPCHRVVAAAGIGGFAHHRDGFLLGVKRWLLTHEQSAFCLDGR